MLHDDGIGTRVVSMPCRERFEAQEESHRERVLPAGPVRIGIEAASRMGWDRWLTGKRGWSIKWGFVDMDGFGASAAAGDLCKHLGITAEAVTQKVRDPM